MINLYDEVRNGFYISSAIKQAWASQLKVLFEIDKICENHDIDYFADWGTLLSAIRHGGYIPWDDDLDICMKREDYIKFREVADEELPEEFAIQDYKSQSDHWLFITKVVNCNHISFDKEHLDKYDNFPYIACVDIFILDYLYEDDKKERERCDEIKYLLAVADGIVEGKYNPEKQEQLISDIEERYQINIISDINIKYQENMVSDTDKKYQIDIKNYKDVGKGVRDENSITRNINGLDEDNRAVGICIYELIEQQMARVKESDSNRIGQIFPWVLKGFTGYPKEYYEKSINVPYEGASIRVPVAYDEILKYKYGNYLSVIKGSSAHDYPFFEGQKQNLYDEFGREAFEVNKFKFDPSMLNLRAEKNADTNPTETFNELVKECINQIKQAHAALDLPLSQQLAIDLGEMIDQVKGEGSRAVKTLEEYCKDVYLLYEAMQEENGTENAYIRKVDVKNRIRQLKCNLDHSLNKVIFAVSEDVLNKDLIVFLTVGKGSFNGMKRLYNETVASGAEVYVMELPLYKKDCLGKLLYKYGDGKSKPDSDCVMSDDDKSDFDTEVQVMSTELTAEYLSFIRPDKIYTNYCYDDTNPIVSIHPDFYSKKLINYTDKLIYVQPWEMDDFSADDVCSNYNLYQYAPTPAVVYADEVLLFSEGLKDRYVDALTKFSGEEYENFWREKIKFVELFSKSEAVDTKCMYAANNDVNNTNVANNDMVSSENLVKKKTLLYCIGICDLVTNPDIMIEKIDKNLGIFMEHGSDISVDVRLFPESIDEWKKVNSDALNSILNKIKEYETKGICQLKNDELSWKSIDECDAYYGVPSPIVLRFNKKRKPVMIRNMLIDML